MSDVEFFEVKYPSMRDELIHNLKKLSSIEYQREVWVGKKYPKNVEFDSFDLVVNFIYDDTAFGDAPASMLGFVLINKAEVDAVCCLVDSLNLLFDRYGVCLLIEEYIVKPEWAMVVDAAQQAILLLNSKKVGFHI